MKYLVTLNNRKYILYSISRIKIRRIISLVLVRNLENRIIIINNYIILIIYVDRLINNSILKIIYFFIKVYLVNNLKTNLLIKNNIFIL